MISKLERITPEIAKEYMTHNMVNRPIRSHHLDEIARDMKNGNWHPSHLGIAFDRKGNLIDGQHRLMAIILSGATVDMYVTRDVDDEAIMNIDTNATRSFSDAYKIKAAISGDEVDLISRNKSAIAAVRTIVRCGYNGNIRLSNSEIDALVSALTPQLRQLYKICLTRGKTTNCDIYGAILAALICGEPEEDLHKFNSVFLFGNTNDCDGFNTGAAFRLATIMMDAKIKHIRLMKERIYKLTQNAIWQFLHGADTRLLREPKQYRYPVALVIKSILGG